MLITLLFAALGLIGGGFLTVVITRGPVVWKLVERPESVPNEYGLARPRSHCPRCQQTISPLHLIPVVGYFLTKRRCGSCDSPIPSFYPTIELAGLSSGIAAALFMPTWSMMAAALVFLLALIAAGAIDARTGFLPDAITLPLVGLGIGLSAANVFVPWPEALAGAIVGYGVFWTISTIYRQMRGHDGLGLGDAKLLAAIGAFTGIFALPFVIFISATTALIVALTGAVRRGEGLNASSEIRFGPFLAFGGAVVLLALPHLAII